MKIKNQIIVAAFGLVVAVAAIIGIFLYMNNHIDYSAIDYITDNQRGPNSFSDIAGQINVHSANDLGYQVKGDYHILIFYGSMNIDVPKTAFFDSEFNQRLAKIGIVIKYRVKEDGTIQYRVTYWDEVIDQYSTVS